MLLHKIKGILFALIGLLRRCFCCFKRRGSVDLVLPITFDSNSKVINNRQLDENCLISPQVKNDICWEDWDGPSTIVCDGDRNNRGNVSKVEHHIRQYREEHQRRLVELQQPQSPDDPKPDLFQDLAPELPRKPQVIIYARPNDEVEAVQSKQLGLTYSDAILQVGGGDLGDWDEEGGEEQWGSDDEEALEQALYEQKQQQRQMQKQAREARRQQKLLAASKNNKSKLATKIS